MKISFLNNSSSSTTYTYELLKYISKKNKHEITSHNESDIICVSLTSHYEIDILIKARKQFPEKKIIVGGHASNAPLSLLVYADYVNLGAGFEFFKDFGKIDIENMPYILSKGKTEGHYSNLIEWDKLPIIQIAKNSYSYLESVGCSHKCKFCLTSWLNKHQKNNDVRKLKKISDKFKGKQLYFIGNNYEQISCNLNVSDATIKGYNLNSNKYKDIKLIRVGLESINESTRRSLSKPIIDDEVIEFFERTKFYGKQANIFLIAGLDHQECWDEFIKILPYQPIDNKPRLGVIINYFDPSMGTPFARENLFNIIPIDIPRIKRIWKLHNARINIFRDLKISWKMSTIDSLIQRSTNIDELSKLLEIKKIVYNDIDDFHNDLIKAGFEKHMDGTFKYPIHLINWHNKNYW